MHSKDVVHTADSQTFTNEGNHGRAELAHCSDDVCFRLELICDALAWAHRHSRGSSRSATQYMTSVFCLWIPFRTNLFVGRQRPFDKRWPALGGKRCHRHPGIRNPPSLRFHAKHVAGEVSVQLEGLCTSSSLCAPTHGTCPADCCPATCSRASAATVPVHVSLFHAVIF